MEPTKLADRLPQPERHPIPAKVRDRALCLVAECKRLRELANLREQGANDVVQTWLDVAEIEPPEGKVFVPDEGFQNLVAVDKPGAPAPTEPTEKGTLPQEVVAPPVPSTPGA